MPPSEFVLPAIDFIEANLRQPLAVAAVAEKVCVSLFHFSRVFSGATGHAPYDYLMRRRLSAAAIDLMQTDEKVIDLALDYQFHAPETFSRAFRRMFGCPPSEVRKRGCVDERLLLPRFDGRYLRFLSHSSELSRKMMSAMPLAGLATMTLPDGVPGALARQARQLEPYRPATDSRIISVVLPLLNSRHVQVMSGYVLDSQRSEPPALLRKELPGGEYAFLSVTGVRDVPLARRYLLHSWWAKRVGGSPPAWELILWLEDGLQVGLPLHAV